MSRPVVDRRTLKGVSFGMRMNNRLPAIALMITVLLLTGGVVVVAGLFQPAHFDWTEAVSWRARIACSILALVLSVLQFAANERAAGLGGILAAAAWGFSAYAVL